MLDLISNLATLPSLPRPQLLAQTSAIAGGQRGGHTVARARDVFALILGSSHAADIGGLTKAAGNARAGASLLQAANLGLDAIDAALTTMKALATQASSTTTPLSRGERAILNTEFEGLRAEIDRIADRTEFNNTKVLKGIALTFKVGTGNASEDSILVSLSAATVAGLDAGLTSDMIAHASGASLALTNVTSAIDALKTIQSLVDGATVGFQVAERNLTSDKSTLSSLRTDLLERPETIGTADILAKLVNQEFLSQAALIAVGHLSSAVRVLLSTTQLQPIEPSRTDDQLQGQEEAQSRYVKGPSAYETAHNNKSVSRSEDTHGVDIET